MTTSKRAICNIKGDFRYITLGEGRKGVRARWKEGGYVSAEGSVSADVETRHDSLPSHESRQFRAMRNRLSFYLDFGF